MPARADHLTNLRLTATIRCVDRLVVGYRVTSEIA